MDGPVSHETCPFFIFPGRLNMKQYSEACDENKAPILDVIRAEFSGCHRILEIGSGSGQHAVLQRISRVFPERILIYHWKTAC